MKLNRCLIIDTETSGLADDAELLEIGMVLYSVTNQCTLQEFSTLLPAANNEAEAINRIKVAALQEVRELTEPNLARAIIEASLFSVDAIVAHNVEFDRPRFTKWLKNGDEKLLWPNTPWICTMADFKWPLATKEQGSLINLALDHGIGVASAHRALTDCRLIASLFDRMTDLQSMFQIAMRPKGLFQALVSYDDRELAKQAGFKWDGTAKTWTRQLALEDAEKLGFRVRRLDRAA